MVKNILFFISIFIFSITAQYASTIFVSPNGKNNSIAKAIQMAQSRDKIVIKPGKYFENAIVIDKPLDIEGELYPILDGNNKEGVFIVKSDSVTIKGLQIQNIGMSQIDDRAGIKFFSVKNCLVENNKLINTQLYFFKVN